MTRRTGVLLTILALLSVLGSLCACAADSANGNGPQTSQTPTVAAPATTPTPSKPTIPQSALTLGGSVVSFDKKFGASNCCYENGWDYQGPYGPMWTGIDTDHTPASNVDEGSTQRVISIENAGGTYSDLTLTVTQAKSLCGSFLPSDAKLQHTITVSLGSVVAGSELRYSSTLLANTLPPSDFTDRAGKAVSPGTIFVYYDYTYNGSSTPLVSDCALATDESLIVQLPS